MGLYVVVDETCGMAAKVVGTIVLTLILLGCTDGTETTVASSSSPTHATTIEVRARDAAVYGPHPIRIVKRIKGQETLLEKTEIRNDGANLGSGNVKIVWMDERRVTVTLSGQEQEPKSYTYEI